MSDIFLGFYVGSDKFLITFKLALKSQSIFGKNKSLSN